MSDEPRIAGISFEETDVEEFADLPAHDAVQSYILHAARAGASDVYFLSDETSAVVAMRRLGTVEKIATLEKDAGSALIRSLKANAGLDIAETRRPLEGRYIQEMDDHKVDLRINCIPTLYGEDLTCRILDRTMSLMTIEQLGMTHTDKSNLIAMLSSPSGLILVTGPTGTGKTTTLYASLQYLNDGSKKINTLEDPIEYGLEGVRQTQVMQKLGINFSDLLPNILRQSPDIIMIGEVRDEETARTAVRAASSGHLVLATLHAPVAAGAVQSMLALGSHPHFLASSLLGVVAQRLIRVLSTESRIEYDISASPETFKEIQNLLEPGQGKVIFGPDPTDENSQDGYNTRTGLFEIMVMNRELRRLIVDGRPSSEIEEAAIRNGMIEFHRSALLMVAQGITSTEEMMRAVPSEFLGVED